MLYKLSGNLLFKINLTFLLVPISLAVGAQQALLTIKVIYNHPVAKTDSLVIMGNQPVFGDWFDFSKGKMKQVNDSTWVLQNHFPVHTSIEFQLTRGSYDKAALYTSATKKAPGVPFKLIADTTVVIRPANWNDTFNNSITGTLKYYHNVESHDLKYTRDVMVWLPPSYFKNPARKFPVLYAEDGQNLFSASNINSGEWRMDETADSLMRKGIVHEFIIVGINNTKDRWEEYSGTAKGEAYMRFIVTELKPFIDSHFRTLRDKYNTAAIGSSMGGLISFYLAWRYPDVFAKAASLSGGFAYDNGHIVKNVAHSAKRLTGTKLYLDCGDQGLDAYFLPDNNLLYTILHKDHPEVALMYRIYKGKGHNEDYWAERLAFPLQFLFGN